MAWYNLVVRDAWTEETPVVMPMPAETKAKMYGTTVDRVNHEQWDEPVQPPPPVAPKVPVPAASIDSIPEMDDNLRKQYVAITEELGITLPGLMSDRARAFFRDRGTRLYDRTKVTAFLTDQYGAERVVSDRSNGGRTRVATWGWRPLRSVDVSVSDGHWGFRPSTNGEVWTTNVSPYAKAIPLPVLFTARDVVAEFPQARLYVSDELHANELRRVDDPFLMVVIAVEYFIIERWDEPAYRE